METKNLDWLDGFITASEIMMGYLDKAYTREQLKSFLQDDIARAQRHADSILYDMEERGVR